MYEEPPPLPFPSLQSTKSIALDILKIQRTSTTPDVEFKIFDPEFSTAHSEKRKRTRQNCKACEVCKKKKIRCDINTTADEPCTRTNCQCLHHRNNNITQNRNDADGIVQEVDTTTHQQQANTSNSTTIIDQNFKATSQQSNNNNNAASFNQHETIPSSTVFRKPGLLKSGHFTGETSFCEYFGSHQQPSIITLEANYPTLTAIPREPKLSKVDQLHLVDVYYENLNPFYPLINKDELIKQMEYVFTNKESYLSPLFYYALFARAAQLQKKASHQQQAVEHRSYVELGEECLAYSSFLIHYYRDKPRISTILALVIMANHLEQKKRLSDLTKVWLWVGEAFRMALDLGIHRSFVTDEKDSFGQLCIRTFWLTYVTDCTISMIYGRPSATEEKVFDAVYPKKLESDDDHVSVWIEGLDTLIALSKVTSRVIRFNYCPPPPFIVQGPIKRHNAFLVSVDSWLIDIMYPSKEPESPFSSIPNIVNEETSTSRRLMMQNRLVLYTNLILLHRPYVSDTLSARNVNNRPSYDICSYAAIIITDLTSKLDTNELLYHSTQPILAYALIMAIRIHIMNAAGSNPEKFNARKNFEISLATLSKLPQSQDISTTLHEAIRALERRYNNRYEDSVDLEETEDQFRTAPKSTQQVITTAQIVFSPNALEKPTSFANSTLQFPSNDKPQTVDQANVANARTSLVIRDYTSKIDSAGRKKKKTKIKHPKHSSSSSTNTRHQSRKMKKSDKALEPSSATDTLQTREHSSTILSPQITHHQYGTVTPTSSVYNVHSDHASKEEYFPALDQANNVFNPLLSNQLPLTRYEDENTNNLNPSITFSDYYAVQNGFTITPSTTSSNQLEYYFNPSLFPSGNEATTSFEFVPVNSYPEQTSLEQQQIPLRELDFLNNDLFFNNYSFTSNTTNSNATNEILSTNNSVPFFTQKLSQHISTSSNNAETPIYTDLSCQDVFINDINYK